MFLKKTVLGLVLVLGLGLWLVLGLVIVLVLVLVLWWVECSKSPTEVLLALCLHTDDGCTQGYPVYSFVQQYIQGKVNFKRSPSAKTNVLVLE